MKAQEFLQKMRYAPGMYASNKESFCAQVVTALIMDDINFHCPGYGNSVGNFYAKHIGHYGNSIVGCNDSFDDDWAHSVIDDALSFIAKEKSRHNINYQVDGKPACQICNPIEPCHKSSICNDCFKWLKEEPNGNDS